MPNHRPDRLKGAIMEEISSMLRKDLKDPRLGFATITDVEVTPDLRSVRVFVSILGDDTSKAQTMQALESARGYIRAEIGRRIRLRYTPEISFKYDASMERASRIFELLTTVRRDEGEVTED